MHQPCHLCKASLLCPAYLWGAAPQGRGQELGERSCPRCAAQTGPPRVKGTGGPQVSDRQPYLDKYRLLNVASENIKYRLGFGFAPGKALRKKSRRKKLYKLLSLRCSFWFCWGLLTL